MRCLHATNESVPCWIFHLIQHGYSEEEESRFSCVLITVGGKRVAGVKDDPISSVLNRYSEVAGIPLAQLEFRFQGKKITDASLPLYEFAHGYEATIDVVKL